MKRCKQALALLLCLVMLLSLFPAAVFAETEDAASPEDGAEATVLNTPEEAENP